MQNVTNTWLTNENPNVQYLNLDVVFDYHNHLYSADNIFIS